MDNLAGGAKRTGRSVRGVARWAHNTSCGVANAMFAARVDSDRLLKETSYEAEFGQSPFAIARGNRVEAIGWRDNSKVTFELLQEHFGFAVPEVVPLDMRHGFAKNSKGMEKRAALTRDAIERILRDEPGAPNVIDGAVLAATIGGHASFLEADGVGAKAGPVLNINEFKGWPVVDGQADDSGKFAESQRQIGIYRPPGTGIRPRSAESSTSRRSRICATSMARRSPTARSRRAASCSAQSLKASRRCA